MKRFFVKLSSARPSRPMVVKMFTFGLVGIVNTVVDLAMFTLAYTVFHLSLAPSNVLSWVVAVTGSYLMNTMITFRAESGRVIRASDYLRFVTSGVAGVIGTTTTLVILANFTSVLVAKLVATLVAFLINFTLSHFVVFRAKSPASGDLNA